MKHYFKVTWDNEEREYKVSCSCGWFGNFDTHHEVDKAIGIHTVVVRGV